MAVFSLLLCQSPFEGQGNTTALRFVESAISQGHDILGVFFYLSSVNSANSLQQAPSDEPNVSALWEYVHSQHGIPLHLCVTAAARRGILARDDAMSLDVASNLSACFEPSGLGELMKLYANSDRVIQL